MRITEFDCKNTPDYKEFRFTYYDEWEPRIPGCARVGSSSFIVRARKGDIALEFRSNNIQSAIKNLRNMIDLLEGDICEK